MPVDNDRVSTGELYSQKIDSLEGLIRLKFSALGEKVDKLSEDTAKATDTIIEAGKERDKRIRDLELKQVACAQYRVAHTEAHKTEEKAREKERKDHQDVHNRERGVFGTLIAVAGAMGGWEFFSN